VESFRYEGYYYIADHTPMKDYTARKYELKFYQINTRRWNLNLHDFCF
jgi:hypothetical protein